MGCRLLSLLRCCSHYREITRTTVHLAGRKKRASRGLLALSWAPGPTDRAQTDDLRGGMVYEFGNRFAVIGRSYDPTARMTYMNSGVNCRCSSTRRSSLAKTRDLIKPFYEHRRERHNANMWLLDCIYGDWGWKE